MTKKFTLLTLAALFAATATQAQSNLLRNGGFEESSSSFLGTSFDSWDKIPSSVATAETSDKVEGSQSMKLTKAKNNQREFYQEIYLDGKVAEGEKIEVSLWYKKTVAVGEEDIIFTGYFIRNGATAEKSDTLTAVLAGGSDWTKYAAQLTCPAKASRFVFDVQVATGTTTLFDDCQIVLVTDDKPAIDWATEATYDLSSPLALLDEPFDNVDHNKTLVRKGWQNIAAADARPWWGYAKDDESCAKATAYQYATETTATWTMSLITPALDYKKAATKVFSFKVKGEYLTEDAEQPATLEIYYVDATITPVYKQKIDMDIPATADESGKWIEFRVDLTNQPIADAFFMEFRYTAPNGNNGATTYYIDDVTWGSVTTGLPTATIAPDGNAQRYNLLGQPVDEHYRGVVIQNGRKFLQR